MVTPKVFFQQTEKSEHGYNYHTRLIHSGGESVNIYHSSNNQTQRITQDLQK